MIFNIKNNDNPNTNNDHNIPYVQHIGYYPGDNPQLVTYVITIKLIIKIPI